MDAAQVSEFEVFVHRAAPSTTQPYVTIQKRGMLSINGGAYELLGRPSSVELMYDAKRRRVGLRGVQDAAPHAYPLRPVSGKDTGPFLISGTAFLKYFRIGLDVSRRWIAQAEGHLVWIDLSIEGVPVTSNRASTTHRPFRRQPE